MVPSEEEDLSWISQFVCNEERDCFHTEATPVDKIAQKQVVGVGKPAADSENLQYVEELSVGDHDGHLLYFVWIEWWAVTRAHHQQR